MIHGIVHDFRERLEFSQRLSDEPAWIGFYQRLWPDMVCIRTDHVGRQQRDGVDRLIILSSGKQYRIDEKKRERDYGDILLEKYSVFYGDDSPRNKPGWTVDPNKHCDFIAYAIVPAAKCYFLPYEHLRQAFMVHGEEWERTFGIQDAKNIGYRTRNIAVTWPVLQKALIQQMNRRFGDRLELPTPLQHGSQLEFIWGEQ